MFVNELLGFIKEGGYVFMGPLILMSTFSLAVIIDRVYFYSFRVKLSDKLLNTLLEAARQGNADSLITACKGGSLITVLLREAFSRPLENGLEAAVAISAQKHLAFLNHRLWLLRAVGHIAPLLGLLGTVVGLAMAFKNISTVGLSQQSVAQGISMALITTITGLTIALPSLLAEYCLRAWAQSHFHSIQAFLNDLVGVWGCHEAK